MVVRQLNHTMKANLCVLLMFHLLFLTKSQDQPAICLTPDNEAGTCINIKECDFLITILRKPKPLPPADLQLLQQSRCGFDGSTPRVCCPLNRDPTTTTTTTTTTQRSLGNSLLFPDVSGHRNFGLINPQECGSSTFRRISGGNRTELFEFPWMALLGYRSNGRLSFRCGGTLINDRYILTAAHCITNLGENKTLAGVRLGEHNIDTNQDCMSNNSTACAPPVQDFSIEQVIPHPEYSHSSMINDIGLLRLRRRPTFNSNVRPICLPVGNERFFTNTRGVVAGWGATESGQSSSILLKVELPVIANENCSFVYRRSAQIVDQHLCAGGFMGRDSCGGDSGGPFMFPGELHNDARMIQHGIVSFGPLLCGTEGFPGVYTRVAAYMDWILNTLRQ